jgi:uncharacterized membrane protein YheB (UPF0754 family)
MTADFVRDPEFWKLASIPVVAGVVGWFTNWVAIVMSFHPLRRVGWPPLLGWHGIIPSKAAKMAGTFVDSTMARLGTVAELFEQIEPERVAAHAVAWVEPRMGEYTDEVMRARDAVLWENLPELVKDGIRARARRRLPPLVGAAVEEIGRRIDELLDFRQMIVGRLAGDPALLNRLFLESGAREFRFIVRSGLYFGFLFGLVQLAVWVVYPAPWVLPAFGAAVGWATNWIALNLVFRPLQPRKIGPFTLHGLFLRRQREVAAVWCRIVTREILTVRNLIRALLSGPRAERAQAVIRRHLRPLVDESVDVLRPVAQAAVGLEGYAGLRETVGEKAVAISAEPFDDPFFNEARARRVESLLRERMEALPSEEFQDLLRPCFQEDEMKLIVLGGVLGLLAGLAQLLLVFR